MQVAVVSLCAREKRFDPVLDCQEIDATDRRTLANRYPDHTCEASEMYQSPEYEHVRTAVADFEAAAATNWYVLSAGYGLISADERITAYDCTFTDPESVADRAARRGYDADAYTHEELIDLLSAELGIHEAFTEIVSDHDIVFVPLIQAYAVAARRALEDLPDDSTVVALTAEWNREFLCDAFWLRATEREAEMLDTTLEMLRVRQLRNVAGAVESETDLRRMQINPERAYEASLAR